MAGGILSGGEKRSPEQIAEIEAANRMEAVDFTTPSGSQGVTNSNYADYVRRNPDLMANYNKHWKAGAPEPFSGKNEGISLAEYGAMHWNQSGRNEGRSMPGLSSAPAPESGGGGSSSGSSGGLLDSSGPPMGPFPEENVYFPMLVPDYAPPSAQDFTAYMPRVGPYDAPTPYLGGGAPANFPQATLYSGIGQDVDPGIPDYNIGGLLYQPWTTEYQQAFVQPNIWNYEPNQFGVGPVQHMGAPFGPLNVVPPEELFAEDEEEEEEERGGGGSRNEDPGNDQSIGIGSVDPTGTVVT